MIYLTRKIEFSASHYYWNPEFTPEENRRVFGKCMVVVRSRSPKLWLPITKASNRLLKPNGVAVTSKIKVYATKLRPDVRHEEFEH